MNARFVVSVLLPFAACAVQWLLWDTLSPYVWFLFFPTAFFSAWLGGFLGGLISTLTSTVLVWYVFIPPRFSFTLDNSSSLFSMVVFVFMGSLFAYVFDRLQQAMQRADEALSQTEAAKEQITQLYKKTLELDKLKSNFFANVSHELRTPLTLIMSPLTRRLSVENAPQALRLEDEMMLRNARHLYRRVTDLLDAARLEAGKMTAEYARVDIGALTRSMAAQFDTIAKDHGFSYGIDVLPTLEAEVDSAKVQRIVLNLLSNAFKFTPEGGSIEVRLHNEAGEAVLEVQDNGPGVPANMQEQVFERFQQVEGGVQRRFGGTGLGLAIVREFTLLHGGSVRLGNAAGGGVLVVVRLPLHAPAGAVIMSAVSQLDPVFELQAADDSSGAAQNAAVQPGNGVPANAPLVLVVEDNVDMNAYIADTLRSRYRVSCAFDGIEGLALASALKLDLIVCDVMMPRLSGDQMVLELRKQHAMADIPILILTAKADDDLRLNLLSQGVQGYLNKPFTAQELLAQAGGLIKERKRVTNQLRESEARFQATFEQAAVGIALVAPDGHWLRVNRKLCQIVGYTQEELITQTFQAITYPADLDLDLANVEKMLSGEIQTYSMEKRYIRKDRSLVWINLTVALIHKTDGTPDYFISVVEDIQMRKQAEIALHESSDRFASVFQTSPIGMAIGLMTDGTFVDVNQSFEGVLGYSRGELLGKTGADIRMWVDNQARAVVLRLLAAGETVRNFEARFRRKSGEVIDISYSGRHFTISGKPHFIGMVADITQRKRAEEAMRIAATVFESHEGMAVTDASRVILRVNEAFTKITGYTAEEAVGQTPGMLKSKRHDAAFYTSMWACIEQTGTWEGEIWNRHKSGEIFPEWLTISSVRNAEGIATHYVAIFSDMSARKAAESQIRNLAFFDPLTGLPNRRLLLDRLGQTMAVCARHKRSGALLFIDLDDFKTINDTLGHHHGDQLLEQVAKRLTSCVREGDTVARLGGDEFVVMLEELSEDLHDAASQAEIAGGKILQVCRQSYHLGGTERHLTASIGVTLFGVDPEDDLDLPLKRADMAMYQAKAAGRNTLRFFDPEMQVTVMARAALELGLRDAMQLGQFLLHYQIQVDANGSPVGVEALLRWNHPARGLVHPAEFIPLAEETGLILPLGQWVLETACLQLVAWSDQPSAAHLLVAVNVSARQFHQNDFVDQVLQVLKRTGANPHQLKLELTESMLVTNVQDVIAKMNALKTIGVGFSLDDFGTGYSSLSYLKRLPLDQLKIDKSFVEHVLSDSNDAAIARMVIVLAQSLGLAVIAEGVETEAQRDYLVAMGCHFFQGYLYGRPLPIEDLASFLKLSV